MRSSIEPKVESKFEIKQSIKEQNNLIFDMDGVIVDTMEFHYLGWRNYFKRLNHIIDKDNFLHNIFGTPGRVAVREILGNDLTEKEVLEHCNNIDAEFREVISHYPDVTPIKGFIEFITSMNDLNYNIALATSAHRENVDVIFDRFKIAHFFDLIISAEDFHKGKPDPEIYLKTLGRLGSKTSNSIVFEDSIAGVRSAISAGIKVIGITSTQTPEMLYSLGAVYCVPDFTFLSKTKIEEIYSSI